MSTGSWPPGQPPPPNGPPHGPYEPPQGPHSAPQGLHSAPQGPYGPQWPPRPPASVRTPTPTTLILARIASITLSAVGLLLGLIGSAVIMTPTTMMVTGCSGDSGCLQQFFWVLVLPPLGCGLGALVALVGTIVQWRSHWVVTWGVIAIGLSVAGSLAALRIAGYWPLG